MKIMWNITNKKERTRKNALLKNKPVVIFYLLLYKDSNLERLHQKQLCYQLHHKAIIYFYFFITTYSPKSKIPAPIPI